MKCVLTVMTLCVFSVCLHMCVIYLFGQYEPFEHLAQRIWFTASPGSVGPHLQQPEPQLPAWKLLLSQ